MGKKKKGHWAVRAAREIGKGIAGIGSSHHTTIVNRQRGDSAAAEEERRRNEEKNVEQRNKDFADGMFWGGVMEAWRQQNEQDGGGGPIEMDDRSGTDEGGPYGEHDGENGELI